MKLWDIVGMCATGAYVEGDSFVSKCGCELYFDGERLVGIEKANIKGEYKYAGVKGELF